MRLFIWFAVCIKSTTDKTCNFFIPENSITNVTINPLMPGGNKWVKILKQGVCSSSFYIIHVRFKT